MKAAALSELQELHKLIVQALTQRVKNDMEDKLPTDAATLGVIVKLLKDNAVTSDPADSDDLQELRDRFTEQQRARRERGSNIVALASADIKTA